MRIPIYRGLSVLYSVIAGAGNVQPLLGLSGEKLGPLFWAFFSYFLIERTYYYYKIGEKNSIGLWVGWLICNYSIVVAPGLNFFVIFFLTNVEVEHLPFFYRRKGLRFPQL